MRFSIITAFVALAGMGSAVPTAAAKSCKTNYFTGFEKLAAGPIDVFNGVPSPFKGLSFPGFTVLDNGLISTIHAQSPKNFIGFSVVNQLLRGNPSISVDYPGSKAKTFALTEVWLGCIIVDPVGLYIPTSCTIQAVGTKPAGGKVYAPLTFNTTLVPTNPPIITKKINQQKQVLPESFHTLKNITFEVTSAGLLPLTTEFLLDSFSYTVTSAC